MRKEKGKCGMPEDLHVSLFLCLPVHFQMHLKMRSTLKRKHLLLGQKILSYIG